MITGLPKWTLIQWISISPGSRIGGSERSSFFSSSLTKYKNQGTSDKSPPLSLSLDFRNLSILLGGYFLGTDTADFKAPSQLFFNPRGSRILFKSFSPSLSLSIYLSSPFVRWRALSRSGFRCTQRLSRGPLSPGSWTGRVRGEGGKGKLEGWWGPGSTEKALGISLRAEP